MAPIDGVGRAARVRRDGARRLHWRRELGRGGDDGGAGRALEHWRATNCGNRSHVGRGGDAGGRHPPSDLPDGWDDCAAGIDSVTVTVIGDVTAVV